MHLLCIHLSTMIISVSLRILETWSRRKKTKFLGRISRFLLLYTSGVPFGVVVYSPTNYTPILLSVLETWNCGIAAPV